MYASKNRTSDFLSSSTERKLKTQIATKAPTPQKTARSLFANRAVNEQLSS
jgi:hypothetical protein